MTAVHREQENVGLSRKVMTTFDFVSDVGDIVGAAMALLSVLWTVTLPSAERYAGARVHQRDVGQSSTKEARR